jgi:hypothetical protein
MSEEEYEEYLTERLTSFYTVHAPHKIENIGNLVEGITDGDLTVRKLCVACRLHVSAV